MKNGFLNKTPTVVKTFIPDNRSKKLVDKKNVSKKKINLTEFETYMKEGKNKRKEVRNSSQMINRNLMEKMVELSNKGENFKEVEQKKNYSILS